MRWVLALTVIVAALLVAACAQDDYVGPSEGPPGETPFPISEQMIFDGREVHDGRDVLKPFCSVTYQWAHTARTVGWVAVAFSGAAIDPVVDGEFPCEATGTEGPVTYESAIEQVPPGWYTTCNFVGCTEPFEKS